LIWNTVGIIIRQSEYKAVIGIAKIRFTRIKTQPCISFATIGQQTL
jgi:hypothetical protein